MTLTVLTRQDVFSILHNLSIREVEDLQQALRKALHEYSTGTQDDDACAIHQPERTVLVSPAGATTLFMPSTSSSGIGMKVVTFQKESRGSLTIGDHVGRPVGFLNAEEITAFRTALASSLLLVRRHQLRTLTVFGAGKQAYWHIRLALKLRGHSIKTINIINRTFSERSKAFMKSFLSIDHEIKVAEGWQNTRFGMMSPEYGEYDRLIKDQLRAADAIITTVPSTEPLFDHLILTSTEGRKKGRLIVSIGSYKPQMIELPIEILHQAVKPSHDHRHFHRHAPEGGVIVVDTLTGCLKEAGEIIQAGLSPMQLVELGELVLLEMQEAPPPLESHLSDLDLDKVSLDPSSGSTSSMASVFGREDSRSTTGSSSVRSSSLSRALSGGLSRRGSKSDKHRRSSSTHSRKEKKSEKDDHMSRWLSTGNVVYKSVGLGLMDLVIGGELVKLGRDLKIGVTIDDF